MIYQISTLILCLSIFSAPAFAKRSVQELRISGDILWFTEGDLNKDKLNDILISYRRGTGKQAKRFLAVFFRTPKGFNSSPDRAFQSPSNAVAYTIADAIGDEQNEIVYLAADGVYAQIVQKDRVSRPIRIIKQESIVGSPEDEDFPRWSFAQIIDGKLTIILPQQGAISLYQRNGALYDLWSSIKLRTSNFYDAERPSYVRSARGGRSGKMYAFSMTTVIPLLRFLDQTGDGKTDLVAHFEDRVSVYKQTKQGIIESEPSHQRWFQLRTKKEQAARDTSLDIQILDLDGDGIADVSATKISGGVLNMRSETRLYRGQKGGGFSSRPIQTFKDEGFASLVRYVDTDLDGQIEMVHPLSKPSLFSLSRVLLTSQLAVDFRVRQPAMSRKQFFIEEPSFETTSILGLDFSTGGALHGPYPLFGLDLNNDKKPDLGIGQGEKQFEVLWGETKETLSDERKTSFKMKSTRETLRLNPGPGQASEIIFLYKHFAKYSGTAKIVRFQ